MTKAKFLDALLRVPMVSMPLVSPDGKLVAWSWIHKDRRANIYVCPTDGSAKPMRLTNLADDVFPVSWAPGGRQLIVETCEDGNEHMQLLLVDVDPSAVIKELTPAHPPYFSRGGSMHKDGRFLIHGANYDFVSQRVMDASGVFRLDLQTGQRKLLAMPRRSPEYSHNAPVLNAQGTHVLYFRADRDPSGQQVHIVDIHGRRDREVLNLGASAKVQASWMADGKRIVFLADAGHYRRLGIYDRIRGRRRWLIDDAQRNLESVHTVPGRENLVVVTQVTNAHEQCFVLDINSLCEAPVLPQQEDGTLIPLAPGADGSWVGIYYDSVTAMDLVRFQLPKDSCLTGWCAQPSKHARVKTTSLTRTRTPRVRKSELHPARDFFWRSTDGLNVHGFHVGVNPSGPTLVLVHGGPRDRAEPRFDAKVQYLASLGFNIFLPNYRGSTGYGLSFQESIKVGGWGDIEQEDIRTGIKALIDAKLALPGRIGISGTSYGGYSSWHAITHFPRKVVAAAAPICGMTDLVVDFHTTRGDLRTLSQAMMGGTPEELPERYHERSPINFVHKIKAKLLIVQGSQDPNVTPENVRQVRRALKAAGIKHEVLIFDDEGHGIYKPENQQELFVALGRFFRKALAG
jgi:dipeptidyl aminopeptidase/acylaminoacyl peptidase